MYFLKGFFPSSNFPKGISPSGKFLNVQFPKRQLAKSILTAALGPQPVLAAALGPLAAALCPSHCSPRRLKGPNLPFGKLPLGKLHIQEAATWKIATWEVALRKVPLRKYQHQSHSFKYPSNINTISWIALQLGTFFYPRFRRHFIFS